MDLRRKKTVASVDLFEVSVSEDELGVLEGALNYLITCASDSECVARSGATRGELLGIHGDLRKLLRDGTHDAVRAAKRKNGTRAGRKPASRNG